MSSSIYKYSCFVNNTIITFLSQEISKSIGNIKLNLRSENVFFSNYFK